MRPLVHAKPLCSCKLAADVTAREAWWGKGIGVRTGEGRGRPVDSHSEQERL